MIGVVPGAWPGTLLLGEESDIAVQSGRTTDVHPWQIGPQERCAVGRRIFPTEFVNFVDDLIRDQPATDELVELITNWTNAARQPVAD